jgi:hypothetical protein
VRDGIVDIGGFCFCFEPANLPLHAFQVMLPFGPVDPIDSLRVAQDVYAKVPYLTNVFEEKFNQKLLARITDSSYNLGTNFEWKSLSDLKGRRIAGAGLNLNWLKYAGVTPVQSSLPEAYTSMQTRVYDGWIMFPSAWVNLKLHEVGPFYTLIGFGTITWHMLTINLDTWKRLPKEVQAIVLRTAKDFEEQVGKVNRARYQKDIATLRGLIKVNEIDDSRAGGLGRGAEGLAADHRQGARRQGPAGLPGPQAHAGRGGEARPQVAVPLRDQVGAPGRPRSRHCPWHGRCPPSTGLPRRHSARARVHSSAARAA